jgi:murein DD-endopeptidase MepM/ murein hydrolase activator NlpD
MSGPADRILAPRAALDDSASISSEARNLNTTRLNARRRHSRRDVLSLVLGAAALLVVERRAAYAQESSALQNTSATSSAEEGGSPPADAPAADAPPAPAEAPPSFEVTPAPPVAPKTYAVQAGDTLYSIARKHGVSVDAIIWANNLSDANVLKQGQQLVIPPSTGKLHTAREGDTIEALAQSYGVSKSGIVAVNGLAESANLTAGQRLLIPVAVKPPADDPASTPATLQAASVEEPVPIQRDAGTGSPTPPLLSVVAPLVRSPGATTATGAPSVTVTNRKLPKLAWPISPSPPKIGVSQGFRPGHTGIDISAPTGTQIKAAAAGTVKMAEKNPNGFNGYGWIVILDHGDGISTWYAHCSSFNVKPGDNVKAGDTIATVGTTGRVDGSHLHFELRVSASAVDPRLALS